MKREKAVEKKPALSKAGLARFHLPQVKRGSFLEVSVEDMEVTFQTWGFWSFFAEGKYVGYWAKGPGCAWKAPNTGHPGPAWELRGRGMWKPPATSCPQAQALFSYRSLEGHTLSMTT